MIPASISTILGIFAAVAVTGHAATIAYVGEHYNFEDQADDPTVGWRNTTTTKPLDIDGDNIYGTDGYVIMSGLTSLPSYISSVNRLAPNSNSGASFGVMDNPASPSGTDTVNFGVWHNTVNGNLLDFTITSSDLTGQTLRVVFFFDTYNGASSQTYTLTQTVGGSGVASSAVLTGTNGPMDAAFFDLTNVSAGDVFVLSSVGTSGLRHTGGITFDTVATIPEPAAALLGGLGFSPSSVAGGTEIETTVTGFPFGPLPHSEKIFWEDMKAQRPHVRNAPGGQKFPQQQNRISSSANRWIPGMVNDQVSCNGSVPGCVSANMLPATTPALFPSRMRLLFLLGISLLLVPTTTHAARPHKPLTFATTGIQGFALPMWPKVADTVHVTGAEEGSPAFGKLKEGDVIIGINGVKFTEHPLGAFANALDAAEAADGKMPLMMQNGETVTLQLPKLGAYSPTAPYNCPKTDLIIEQTAARLLTEKGLGSTPTRSGLIGLMATGKKEHLDAVAAIIRSSDILKIDPKEVDSYLKTGQPNLGSTGWTWGYNLIALGEYYLLTKDETVLPAIRTYANGLARGQDAVGLWGHRMAIGDKLQRAPGYGIMNAASIPNFVGMLIAQKCGINDPVLDAAIERTNTYVADHIGNGGFPYGVHGPSNEIFNNNGSSGSAAISMALRGNQEGAKYFSRCCATTHGQLNVGHASHFFNPLWTPLGASISGPEVTQEFFKRSLWYFNGKRDWKGGFPGDGNGGFIAAQALLTYCLPRKVLLITGREADPSIWVKDKNEVHDLVTMSQMDYKKKTDEELYELFSSPYPQLRVMTEQELGSRLNAIWQFGNKGNKPDPITPRLRELAMQGSDQVRTSAIRSIGRSSPYIGRENATFLASVFNNTQQPFAIRLAAVTALGYGNCRQDALPYYNDILRLCLEERKKPDPFGHVDSRIAQALKDMFTHLNTPELKKDLQVDRALCYRVAKKFLGHPRQQVRSIGAQLLHGIPLEDFHIVADDLMHTLENKDPSYHTYSSALDADGIEVLATLNIAEGLDLLEDGIFHGDGKWGFKYGALIKTLPMCGANAKPYIARFEKHESINKKGDRFTPAWQAAVKKINEDQNPKKLMTAKEAKEYGEKKQIIKE